MLLRRGADSDFVKVLDFGIARLNWGEQSMATAAGLIFGTARYISPEGAQGEAVGRRATSTRWRRSSIRCSRVVRLRGRAGRRAPRAADSRFATAAQVDRARVVRARVHRRSRHEEPREGSAPARAGRSRASDALFFDAARLMRTVAGGFSSRDRCSRRSRPAVHLPPLQRTDKLHLSAGKVAGSEAGTAVAFFGEAAARSARGGRDDVGRRGAAGAAQGEGRPVSNPPGVQFDRTQAVRPLEDHEIRARPRHRGSGHVSWRANPGPVRGSMPSMDDPGIFEPEPEPSRRRRRR